MTLHKYNIMNRSAIARVCGYEWKKSLQDIKSTVYHIYKYHPSRSSDNQSLPIKVISSHIGRDVEDIYPVNLNILTTDPPGIGTG